MSEEKKWTVMIYLAGDNNLSDEMIWALKEMYRVGTGGACNVVVQMDPFAAWEKPRRYDIGQIEQQGQLLASCDIDGIIESEVIKKALVETSEKDEDRYFSKVLGDFLKWAFSEKKSHNYMLVLSGHASGVVGGFLRDSQLGSGLTITALAKVLEDIKPEGKNIDILGLDCCAMSMAELCHAVHGHVGYVVGAEGFVENAGWPYHRLLECLRERPEPKDLAKMIVDNYYRYYSDYLAAGVSTDQAIVQVKDDRWDQFLIDKVKTLSESLTTALRSNDKIVTNAVVLAHWAAQSFNLEQNVDLFDFCHCLNKYLGDAGHEAICSICTDLTKPENWEKVVPLSLYSGPDYQHAHGLSIYFPWSEVLIDYQKLLFATATGWGDFLKEYVLKTCREIRVWGGGIPEDELPVTIKSMSDGAVFIGTVGEPVYRSRGPYLDKENSPDGTGLNSISGGGTIRRLRAGALDGVRGGGFDNARGGGFDNARFIAELTSMKNSPAGFFQPHYKAISSQEELEKKVISVNIKRLEEQINICDDAVLKTLFNGLSDEKRQQITKILEEQLNP